MVIGARKFWIWWKAYIDSKNAETDVYSELNYECIGTSVDGKEMYVVRKMYSGRCEFVVSNDTVVYRQKVYQYCDFGLLFMDYSCVDYEYHFVNIDTKEETVYRFKPFHNAHVSTERELFEKFNCYIEDGEHKIFYRYAQMQSDYKYEFTAFIYNFDTQEFEESYKSQNQHDEAFKEMAIHAQTAMGRRCGGLFCCANFCKTNGMWDEEEDKTIYIYSYKEIYPGVFLYVTPNMLPDENTELYSRFPEVERYKGEDEYLIYFYFCEDTSYEEIAKMFINDGETLDYTDVAIDLRFTKDGIKHQISSYEEFLEYWDEDKALEYVLTYLMWPNEFW